MKKILFTVAILLGAIVLNAQQTSYKKEQVTYEKGNFISQTTGDTLLYRYLIPEEVAKSSTSGKKYPLVIFLHGSGERGNDNEAQLFHGSGQFLNPVNREKYPAYVLFPQCPEGVPGAYMPRLETLVPADMPLDPPQAPIVTLLMELIDSYIALPNVDSKRVYIMGLSMGGIATFDIVARYPQKFAAAIPICGSVNPQRLKNTKGVAWRIFHGDADASVTVQGSREAYKALKEYGVDVEYIEFAGCTHNSWNPAFNYPDFMKWLFKQKK
ncbi:MAG: prolyl oligopeptidase family serine peptidase [Bacteroidales bacterium]|nr:prolyl oligopeptidase family serine peptidase [Bacteroidales bacterium]